VILFDGRDEAATTEARDRWKQFRQAGAAVSYWKQAERGWEKQA
jgi:DNA polymerase-3 subunit chi